MTVFGDFPAKYTVYKRCMYMTLANPMCVRNHDTVYVCVHVMLI
jgi:hypothetical protein